MKEYLIGKIDDIPEGKGRAFQAGRATVAVFRDGQSLRAQGRIHVRGRNHQWRRCRALPLA